MKTNLIHTLLAAAAVMTASAQNAATTATSPKSQNTRSSYAAAGLGAPGQNPYAGSSARFATRLNSIVRRGNTMSHGSIILTSALKPEQVDELSEDLNVFKFLFNRHLERTFGDQGTEYRLGVPITMRDSRMVELDYVQDFGVIVKVFVPFPVVPSEQPEKKVERPAPADTEWEKAR